MAGPQNPGGNRSPQQKQQLRQRLRQEKRTEHHEERLQKERERFTQAPTGREARHQAHAYAGAEYNPTIRGIREEIAKNAKQQQLGQQYYAQLGQELSGAATASEGAANTFAQNLTNQLAQANATNQQTLERQAAASAQFAALSGMPGPTGQAAAAGVNEGAANAAVLNAPTMGLRYDQAGQLRMSGIGARQRGFKYGQEKQGERKKIRQDLQAAQKQKGQAYVGRLGELRESARKQELDAKAFELEGIQNQQQREAEAAKLAQSERQSQRSAQTSRANSERTAASSAASTGASNRNARVSEEKNRREQAEYEAERRYKRNHGGRTPAEVAALQKERQPSQSAKEGKREELKEGWSAARQAIHAYGKAPAEFTEEDWRALEEHLTDPRTGKEPGAGIPFAVAQRVIEKMKERVGSAKDPNGASLGR